jgi:hypothetical protein
MRTMLIGVLLGFVLLGSASADASVRMATKRSVQKTLVRRYQTSDGENITYARCVGDAGSPHRRSHGQVYFHAFKCREVDAISRVFAVAVVVHVWGLGVVEYGCNDTYSDYSCPSTLPRLRPGSDF